MLHDFELHSWEALSASTILPALSPTFHLISSPFSINNLVTLPLWPYHVSVLSMSEATSPPQGHCWESGEEWEAIFFPSCLKYLYKWGRWEDKQGQSCLFYYYPLLNPSSTKYFSSTAILHFSCFVPTLCSSSPCVWITRRKYFCLASISLSIYIEVSDFCEILH